MKILHLDHGREMQGGQWQVAYLTGGLPEVDPSYEGRLFADPECPLFSNAEMRGVDVRPWASTRGELALGGCGACSRCEIAFVWRVASSLPRKPEAPYVVQHVAVEKAAGGVATGRISVEGRLLSRWKYRQPQLFIAVSSMWQGELRRPGSDDRLFAWFTMACRFLGDDVARPARVVALRKAD